MGYNYKVKKISSSTESMPCYDISLLSDEGMNDFFFNLSDMTYQTILIDQVKFLSGMSCCTVSFNVSLNIIKSSWFTFDFLPLLLMLCKENDLVICLKFTDENILSVGECDFILLKLKNLGFKVWFSGFSYRLMNFDIESRANILDAIKIDKSFFSDMLTFNTCFLSRMINKMVSKKISVLIDSTNCDESKFAFENNCLWC